MRTLHSLGTLEERGIVVALVLAITLWGWGMAFEFGLL